MVLKETKRQSVTDETRYIACTMALMGYFVKVNVKVIYVMPPQSWGDQGDTKHSKCLLLGGRRLNQMTLIPKLKGSGSARAATAQVGPANKRDDTKMMLTVI